MWNHHALSIAMTDALCLDVRAMQVCALAVELHKNTKDMATYVKKEYEQR